MGYRLTSSYLPPCGLGAYGFGTIDVYEHPNLHYYDTDEVYVLRLHVTGARLKSPKDALFFVKSATIEPNNNHFMNPRAVAVMMPAGAPPGDEWLDIIFVPYKSGFPLFLTKDGPQIAAAMQQDPELLAVFPKMVIDVAGAVFGELETPTDAIQHWRAQAPLWDVKLPGGKTDTFLQPAEYSIVLGQAEDGPRSKPWRVQPTPFGPGGGGAGSGGAGGQGTVLWVLGLIAAGAFGAYLMKGRRA